MDLCAINLSVKRMKNFPLNMMIFFYILSGNRWKEGENKRIRRKRKRRIEIGNTGNNKVSMKVVFGGGWKVRGKEGKRVGAGTRDDRRGWIKPENKFKNYAYKYTNTSKLTQSKSVWIKKMHTTNLYCSSSYEVTSNLLSSLHKKFH